MNRGRRRRQWFAIIGCVAATVTLGVTWLSMSGGIASFVDREVGRRVLSLALPSPTRDARRPGTSPEAAATSAPDLGPHRTGSRDAATTPGGHGAAPSSAAEDAASNAPASDDAELAGQWHVMEVGPGDSLYSLFLDLRLSVADLARILGASPEAKERLSRLRPGETLELDVDGRGRVEKLIYHFAASRALEVSRSRGQYRAEVVPRDVASASETVPPALDEGTVVVAPEAAHEATTGDGLAPPAPPEPLRRHLVTVKRGDSMYSIFQAGKLPTADLARMLQAGPLAARLKRLRPGEQLEFHLSEQGSVHKLVYHRNATESLHLSLTDDGYEIARVEAPLRRELANASGTVESSLFVAGQKAGLSDRLIMQMVDIFGWDVDFALDIRHGDRFTLVYEELYKDGQKLRDGAILAAEFVNRDRVIRAVRFVDPHGRAGYYSPEGLSMRKAFLRTPVRYARISSRFSRARRHPVLHTIRAHRGVDYAARAGTPIRAAGDGKVTFVGRKGGYGKTMVLQHGSTYTTLYAHLSRYAKGMRKGRSVRQGEVIGYVGQTGLATGPHLHYEFRVRGVHRDPLKVKLPNALPIPAEHKAEFLAQTKDLVARLDGLTRTQLAAND